MKLKTKNPPNNKSKTKILAKFDTMVLEYLNDLKQTDSTLNNPVLSASSVAQFDEEDTQMLHTGILRKRDKKWHRAVTILNA